MPETSPLPTYDFPQPPDLTDPRVLVHQCEETAKGIDRQAEASLGGSLMAGHPSPGFFYQETGKLLKACAEYIRKKTFTPSPTSPVDPKLIEKGKQPIVAG